MSVNEQRERIKQRLWQAAAQSDVNLSKLSDQEQQQLMDSLTDTVLLEMDTLIGEAAATGVAGAQAAAPPMEEAEESLHQDEQVLWQGRPFLSLGIKYTITSERIRVSHGMLSKRRDDVELVRVQDVDFTQTVRERFLNVGDIRVKSHDPSTPTLVLNDVANPENVHEILRRAVLQARKDQGITFQEEM